MIHKLEHQCSIQLKLIGLFEAYKTFIWVCFWDQFIIIRDQDDKK